MKKLRPVYEVGQFVRSNSCKRAGVNGDIFYPRLKIVSIHQADWCGEDVIEYEVSLMGRTQHIPENSIFEIVGAKVKDE